MIRAVTPRFNPTINAALLCALKAQHLCHSHARGRVHLEKGDNSQDGEAIRGPDGGLSLYPHTWPSEGSRGLYFVLHLPEGEALNCVQTPRP